MMKLKLTTLLKFSSETFKNNEKDKYNEEFKCKTNKTIEEFVNKGECEEEEEEIESINIKNLNGIQKK